MDVSPKNLDTLFEQLGLPAGDGAIETFVRAHGPVPEGRPLWEEPFWSPSQAAFLKEAWEEDADWVEAVDELSALLHQGGR